MMPYDPLMSNLKPVWKPQYLVTTSMVRCLMDIEAVRTAVDRMVIPPEIEVELRRQARLHAAHYSTRIEGNRPESSDVPRLMVELVNWVSLATHPHHNYYEGRAGADLTPWMECFLSTLTAAFDKVRESVDRHAGEHPIVEPEFIRHLDHRTRIVFSLFGEKETVTNIQVAQTLGLSARMARVLIKGWVDGRMLVVTAAARRNRAYGLSAIYR
jgi:hypothetical protein